MKHAWQVFSVALVTCVRVYTQCLVGYSNCLNRVSRVDAQAHRFVCDILVIDLHDSWWVNRFAHLKIRYFAKIIAKLEQTNAKSTKNMRALPWKASGAQPRAHCASAMGEALSVSWMLHLAFTATVANVNAHFLHLVKSAVSKRQTQRGTMYCVHKRPVAVQILSRY